MANPSRHVKDHPEDIDNSYPFIQNKRWVSDIVCIIMSMYINIYTYIYLEHPNPKNSLGQYKNLRYFRKKNRTPWLSIEDLGY